MQPEWPFAVSLAAELENLPRQIWSLRAVVKTPLLVVPSRIQFGRCVRTAGLPVANLEVTPVGRTDVAIDATSDCRFLNIGVVKSGRAYQINLSLALALKPA
jgi:hypothetical protein